jgi:hypothetical protein
MTEILSLESDSMRVCPRCGYSGQGIGYFRRPGHLALLIGASLFTYGFGGLAYWLMRRNRVVCPNCGLTWPYFDSGRLDGPPRGRLLGRAPGEDALPSSGLRRRSLGILMLLAAVIMVVAGIADFETAAVGVGGGFAVAGTGMFFWGWRALQERRAALGQVLERRVLQLAARKGGTLTVTETAAALDLSMAAAEKVLNRMDDGFRVNSEVTDDGIVLYQFLEMQHRALEGPRPLAQDDPTA